MGEIELDAERKTMDAFLSELIKNHPKATYGEKMVIQALDQGAVQKLLISESLRKNVVTLQCNSCNNEWKITIGRMEAIPNCPSCDGSGEKAKEIENISLIDELSTMAAKSNSEIVYISTDTEEGSQLMLGFGGLAAILRYPIM